MNTNRIKKWLIHPLKRRIAKYYLSFIRSFFDIKVIGITGSAGKTTTKEMLGAILENTGEVVCSFKNIDPIFNIPDTILKCRPTTKYLILEMGVEYPGEMDYYLWLAKPDISVITNINPTHLEFFDNIEGVFREKIKIAASLDEKRRVVFNNEDIHLIKNRNAIKAKVKCFGKGTDINSTDVRISRMGSDFTLLYGKYSTKIHLPVAGDHFISNSLAAAAVSYLMGIPLSDVKKGLQEYKPPEHRMDIFIEKKGTLIIDDTYNNNPKAATEALKVFKILSENLKKGIVFGDMLELGAQSAYYHREIGRIISGLRVDLLICIGRDSSYLIDEVKKGQNKILTYQVESPKEAFFILKRFLGKNKIVLIKGSRAIALDLIVEKLSI